MPHQKITHSVHRITEGAWNHAQRVWNHQRCMESPKVYGKGRKMIYCIHSSRLPEAARECLLSLGFSPIALPPSSEVSEAISHHVDLSLFLSDGIGFVTREGYERVHPLCPSLSLSVIEEELVPRYPEEARLNVLTVGKNAFYLKGNAPGVLLAHLKEKGYALHTVKQGYPACTVLALDSRHAISADRGMLRALKECGIEVLPICDGGVMLPPFPYGFLGGAAGVFRDTVYFIGDVRTHPDGRRIVDFIEGCGMRALSLCDGPLLDLGGLAFFEINDDEDGK